MTALVLRPAVRADYTALAFWVTDADVCRQWAGPKLGFPFESAALPDLLDERGSRSFVLVHPQPDDTPLAFGQLMAREPGAAHLARLIVSPEHRGQGLGRQLCTLLMDEARRNDPGIRSFTLRVVRGNAVGLALYRQLGFSEVGEAADADALAMRKPA